MTYLASLHPIKGKRTLWPGLLSTEQDLVSLIIQDTHDDHLADQFGDSL